MKRLLVLGLVICGLASASPAQAICNVPRECLPSVVKQQGRELRQLRNKVISQREALSEARSATSYAEAQLTTANQRIGEFETGLPGAVAAAYKSGQARELVLKPLYYVYHCADFTTVTGSWAYTFYSPDLC